ncbi:MAG: cysteine desulfurase family protein [Oscillospiraceae bacterium]
MIYLDYAANTPTDEAVLQTFCEVNRQYFGNANSYHAAGRAAAKKMEEITQNIAALLGVLPQEIIYTSGASESNNLAIKGAVRANRHTGKHILTTSLEHSSVSACFTALQQQGYEIEMLDLLPNGRVDLDCLEELLRPDTVLVSVCALDGELGTVQPIAKIAQMIKQNSSACLHTDATQAIGKIMPDFLAADCISLAPHKFYGLNGCGLLIKKEKTILEPLIHGGVSTTLYRSGTPAVALAASVEKALALALANQEKRTKQIEEMNATLRGFFEQKPYAHINSPKAAVSHVLNLSIDGVKGDDVQRVLDKHGVCVSVKSACSVQGTPSRAVYAVTGNRQRALSSFRISLGHLTTPAELEEFMKIWEICYGELTNG